MHEIGMLLPSLRQISITTRLLIAINTAYLQAMVIKRPTQEVRIVVQLYVFVSMWRVEVNLRLLPLDSPMPI